MRIIATKVPDDLMLRRMINSMQRTPASFPYDFKNEISSIMKMGYPNVLPKMRGQYGKRLTEIFYNELEKNRIRWKHIPMLKELISELDKVRPPHKLNIIAMTKTDILYRGAKVGHIKTSKTDYGVNIDDIEVWHKGKGLGTKAILKEMKKAKVQGYILTLTSDAMRGKASQKLNRELYLKLGFIKNSKDSKIKNISEEFYYPKQ